MADCPIFISYRRDDSAGYARAVYEALARHWGADQVFMDVDDIGAGQAFAQVLQQAVGDSRVLLVLIGPRWAGPRPGQPPRLHEPDDFVSFEVATALARGLPVLPLLLDGATMPAPEPLPQPLKALAGLQALELRHSQFAADMDRLNTVLAGLLGPTVRPRPVQTAVAPDKAAATLAAAAAAPAGAAGPVGAASATRGADAGQPRGATSGTASQPQPPTTSRPARWWLPALGLGVAGLLALLAWLFWRPPAAIPGNDPPPATALPGGANPPVRVARPAVNGRWQAEVTYDWPNARYTEQLDLSGSGSQLVGSISFLGVPRGLEQASVDADGLRFVVRRLEQSGSDSREVLQRYSGQLVDGELQLVMQAEGGFSPHVPVRFTARRILAAASATGR